VNRRLGWALALLGASVALADPAFAQCAMCKTTVTGSVEGQAVARQLNEAILLMFLAPYLVFGSLVAVVFRNRIRRQLSRVFWRATR